MCVLITSVLSGRVHDAKVHIGGNSVTASFNIIEDFADIRWGKDMLKKNSCNIDMGENVLGLNSMAITTPIVDIDIRAGGDMLDATSSTANKGAKKNEVFCTYNYCI